MNMKRLVPKIKKIKLIILDVDGVLTDGGLILGHDGFEYMKFNVQDGAGIVMASKMGYPFALITGRNTKIVEVRAKMLGITDVFQKSIFKIDAYLSLLEKYKCADEQVCYMGDDILDLPLLKRVGLAIAPASAVKDVRLAADYITRRAGGEGAVREAIDMILDLAGKKKQLLASIMDKSLPVHKLS